MPGASALEEAEVRCDTESVNGNHHGPTSPDMLRESLYGQASLDEVAAQTGGNSGELWRAFDRARRLMRTGNPAEAVTAWRKIALTGGVSSRQALQAWYFIRQAGFEPPAGIAKVPLGAAAEVPIHGQHDLLVAYQDGTANYINYSGKSISWKDSTEAQMQVAISQWIAVAQAMANAVGPWEKPVLPPLPSGHGRVMVLTASGARFGQGPEAALSGDPIASKFLGAATNVMHLMVRNATV